MIDGDDWDIFKANHLADMTDLTAAQTATLGDLNGDGVNNFVDFRLFQGDFDGANGLGALAAMIAAVPEPSSLLLGMCGMTALVLRRRSAN